MEKTLDKTVFSMSDVRRTLIAHWSPTISTADDSESRTVTDIWEELVRVSEVAAWRSMSALCGQILEASIRSALTNHRQTTSSQSRHVPFARIIDEAVQSNLFDAPASLTIIGTLHVARQRRNLASHFSPLEQTAVNERDATFLLASLICFSDWLAFGDPRVHQIQVPDEDAELPATHVLAAACNGEPLPEGKTWSSLFADTLRVPSARSITRLAGNVLESAHAPAGELAAVLHEHFHLVIRASARSHVNDVLALTGRLERLGLFPHAMVIGSLLPVETLIVQCLADRRPASALKTGRRLLLVAQRARSVQFRTQTKVRHDIASALQRIVRQGEFDSRDLVALLKAAPLALIADIWSEEFVSDLLPALDGMPIRSYGQLISTLPWSIASRFHSTRHAHQALCAGLVRRCRDVPGDQFFWALTAATQTPPIPALAESVENVLAKRVPVVLRDDPTGLDTSLWFAGLAGCHERWLRAAADTAGFSSLSPTPMQAAAWASVELAVGAPRMAWQDGTAGAIEDTMADEAVREAQRLKCAYAAAKHGQLTASVQREVTALLERFEPQDSMGRRLVSGLVHLGATGAA